MQKIKNLLITLFLFFIVGQLVSQTNQFYTITLPTQVVGAQAVHKISPNGRYVVGYSNDFGYFWDLNTPNDYTVLSGSNIIASVALFVNNSGTVVGYYNDNTTVSGTGDPISIACIWQDGQWTSLGIEPLIPSQLEAGMGSVATAISADGNTVCGYISGNTGTFPRIWTKNTDDSWSYTDYTPTSSRMFSMSGDASVIAGINNLRNTVIWEAPYTSPTIINAPEGAHPAGVSRYCNVSENGRYIALTSLGGNASLSTGNAAIYDMQTGTYSLLPPKTRITGISNDGIAVGFAYFGNVMSNYITGFLYSAELGLVTMENVISTFAPELASTTTIFLAHNDRAFDISSDSKTITGTNGSNVSYVLQLADVPSSLNRPTNLQATITNIDNVTLSWTAPEPSDATLTGYAVYRNDMLLNQIAATTTSYNDMSVSPAGSYDYAVAAIYTTASGTPNVFSLKTSPLSVMIYDNYDMPFFEDFNSQSFATHFWIKEGEISPMTNGWVNDNGLIVRGLYSYGATFGLILFNNNPYSHSLIAKPLDATNEEHVYLKFALKYSLELPDATDTLKVQVKNGQNWETVAHYSRAGITIFGENANSYGWNVETIDLTNVAAGGIFQFRFNVSGENSLSYNHWYIDNIRVDNVATQGNAIEGFIANRGNNDLVDLAWKTPALNYEFTNMRGKMIDGAIGDDGAPFIVANKIPASKVKGYLNKFLTSISFFIYQYSPYEATPSFSLAVFYGNERVTTQPITSFINNAWNTIVLDNAIQLIEEQELKIGIEILSHDPAAWPIGTDWFICYEVGRNVVSEDGGNTWQILDTMGDYGEGLGNLAIVGNITESATSGLITNLEAENIIGYLLYRDGQRVSRTLLPYANFVDNIGTASTATYTASAYFKNGLESPMSAPFIYDPSYITNVKPLNINVFPNPVRDVVTVEGDFTMIKIYDINGKMLMQTTQNPINVSNLAQGIYILKIESGKQTMYSKIVKQ